MSANVYRPLAYAVLALFHISAFAGGSLVCNYYTGRGCNNPPGQEAPVDQQRNDTLRQGMDQVFGGGTSGPVAGAIGASPSMPPQEVINRKSEEEKARAAEISNKWEQINSAPKEDISTDEYLKIYNKKDYFGALVQYSKDGNPDHLRKWSSQNSEFKDLAGKAYFDLETVPATTPDTQDIKAIGLNAVVLADAAEAKGDQDSTAYYYSIARSAADLLIGIDPVTGTVRALYESLTGRNMITGEQLSSLEYGIAIFSVATLGYAGEIARGIEIFKDLAIVSSRNIVAIEMAANYARYIAIKLKDFIGASSVEEKVPEFLKILVEAASGPRLRAEKLMATHETVVSGAMREYPELYRLQDDFIMNYSAGTATVEEMDAVGKAFVGEGAVKKPYPGYEGKSMYQSADGRYVYREPVIKKGSGAHQANLEVYVSPERAAGRSQPLSNAHIDIKP
ncbi:pre-toxin TG domain-containing protein [Pseudomonas paraveronii]|uniref:pre-toxin TG domain-containing protein n=1 Tax=Pseudomonas paraveronii TaxID=3040598 RepID=UPI002AB037F0|nr:pre-toxin TG domain-containing protein [Pseudomonas sp. V3/K/3/5]